MQALLVYTARRVVNDFLSCIDVLAIHSAVIIACMWLLLCSSDCHHLLSICRSNATSAEWAASQCLVDKTEIELIFNDYQPEPARMHFLFFLLVGSISQATKTTHQD
jgi:hypothetical protein